jgi:hypothetical protein
MHSTSQIEELVRKLRSDQRERWMRGERLLVEAYLQQYPEIGNDVEGALELVHAEFCLRWERGENPSVEEYRVRFSHLA